MEATIQMIFVLGYAAYEQQHSLPDHVRYAARCLMLCRTRALGGHVQSCPDGHFHRIWYNSCKHRMCPKCAFIQVERWLAKQKARILCCDHFHVIFTIPDELHFLWRLNVKLMTGILFASASKTLFELLNDDKYLGAQPGMIASLHTWSKTLSLHPHLHFLITGGGLTKGKEWVSMAWTYLLPFRVVRKKFRGKFLALVRKALRNGELALPEAMSPQQLENLLNNLGRRKWNVHLRETYSHGNGVLTYLARYLRGGPISKKRIFSCDDGQVTFNWGREKVERMTLPIEQFIARFLQHVPRPNAIMVRSYGLYHHTKKDDLALCRHMIGQPPIEDTQFIDWQAYCGERGEDHPELCPVCGKRLVCTQTFPRLLHPRRLAMPPPEALYGMAA